MLVVIVDDAEIAVDSAFSSFQSQLRIPESHIELIVLDGLCTFVFRVHPEHLKLLFLRVKSKYQASLGGGQIFKEGILGKSSHHSLVLELGEHKDVGMSINVVMKVSLIQSVEPVNSLRVLHLLTLKVLQSSDDEHFHGSFEAEDSLIEKILYISVLAFSVSFDLRRKDISFLLHVHHFLLLILQILPHPFASFF